LRDYFYIPYKYCIHFDPVTARVLPNPDNFGKDIAGLIFDDTFVRM